MKLGEVCEFVYGYPFDSAKFNNDGNGKALIRIRDVLPGESKTFTTEVPPAKYNVSKGDLLVGMDGDFNVARWRSDDAWLNQRVCMFKPDEQKLLSGYIEFASGKYLSEIWENKAFSTVKHLSAKDLNAIEIPLPPLAVQHEIVARLEKELAMVERMAKGFAALKTEADQLFRSMLKETFEDIKRSGAKSQRLGVVCDCKKGPFGSTLTKSMFVPKGVDTIKVYEQKNAIRKDFTLGTYYITQEYFKSKMRSFEVHAGDIIVSCAGTIGETYILPDGADKGIINQALMRIRTADNLDKSYFLYYFETILTNVTDSSNGSAMKNIPPFKIFKAYDVPHPPFATQRKIVAKLDAVRERCEKLKRAAEEGLQTAALMRKAILKEAFV